MERPQPAFTVTQISPDLWRFNEGMGENPYVDAYLVVGTERAAIIDALQSKQPVSLAKQIREITSLPVDVLLTHGHPDHAGAEVAGFLEEDGFTLYMAHADVEIAKSFAPEFTVEMFIDIKEGDTYDLGGTILTAYCVAGHTPGSYVFLDRENRRCFTGDVFGVWMQLDHSLTIAEYAEELKRFEKTLADVPETVFWTGHLAQAKGETLTAIHATNMREACELLLSGELVGREMELPPGMAESPMAALMKGARIAEHKTVKSLTYKDSKLR